MEDVETIPMDEAKIIFALDEPCKLVNKNVGKLHFQTKENLNMLRIVIASGHYGNGYRITFWRKYASLVSIIIVILFIRQI